MKYRDFGPQVIANEAIGMEWWQWEAHGDSDAKKSYPIKVVVYWDQTLASTKKKYPVDKANLRDYRYVSYDSAVKHMESAIKKLSESGLSVKLIQRSLKSLREARK